MRRVQERDERSTELMRQLAAAQKVAQKAMDDLKAEQVEHRIMEQIHASEVDKLTERCAEAEEKTALLIARADQAEGRASSSAEALEIAHKTHRDAIEVLAEALSTAQRAESALAERAATAEAQADRLNSDFNQLCADQDRKDKHATSQASTAQGERDAARAEISRLQQQLVAGQADARHTNALTKESLQRMEQELAALRKVLEKQHLEGEISKLETETQRRRRAEAALESAKAEVASLRESQEQRVPEEIAKLETEREMRRQAETALELMKAEMVSLRELSDRITAQLDHEVEGTNIAWREIELLHAELASYRKCSEKRDQEANYSAQDSALLKEVQSESQRLVQANRDLINEKHSLAYQNAEQLNHLREDKRRLEKEKDALQNERLMLESRDGARDDALFRHLREGNQHLLHEIKAIIEQKWMLEFQDAALLNDAREENGRLEHERKLLVRERRKLQEAWVHDRARLSGTLATPWRQDSHSPTEVSTSPKYTALWVHKERDSQPAIATMISPKVGGARSSPEF